MVDGRGGGRLETIGAKAVEQGIDVAWVRERKGALGAIVSEGKALKFGCNGMGFYLVKTRKARDKIVVVVAILVLDANIVND